MKKYQIVECGAEFEYAGTKATQDVADIAEKAGYTPCYLRMRTVERSKIGKVRRQIGYFADWEKCCRRIEPGSLVLLQHPFHYPQLTREKCLRKLKKKGVRFICFVHDVEKIRGFRYNNYYEQEFLLMMELADVLIVHNDAMKGYFLAQGVKEERLVTLGIFDYLQKKPFAELPKFDRRIVVAGNLDVQKSAYIRELWKLSPAVFELYGGNFPKELAEHENIEYGGTFLPDEPSDCLKSGLGLVWDGGSLEKCTGDAGNYLRYNNPHKLSLYLSCGLPVVIWKEAAEAAFVREEQAGFCVDSLGQMKELVLELDEDAYRQMAERAAAIGRRLLAGEYTMSALRKAEAYFDR